MKHNTSTTSNGFSLEQISSTLESLQQNPALARFEFRASNQWVNGGENRSRIQGFYGAGKEDTSRSQPFEFTNGEPPILLGNNEGANPVEFLLHALAGCVTTTTVMHATARGIHIRKLSTRLSGEIDLQGLLALDDSVNPGFQSIHIEMDIDADCSEEELDDLLDFARNHSPVCNSVCRPIPVKLERKRKLRVVL